MSGRISLLALPVLSLIAQPALAGERAPVIVKPSSNWTLDYGETRCRIARTFGEGDEKTALYLEQYQPSDVPIWVVGGPLVHRLRIMSSFSARFGPGFEAFDVEPKVTMRLGEFGDAVRGHGYKDDPVVEGEAPESEQEPIGLPSLSPDDGKAIDWIELSRGSRSYRLETGDLGPVFEAMNKCVADLVTYWGADPAILRNRKTAPELTNLPEVARNVGRHYPTAAERNGRQAELHARVMVEADGTVSKCAITAVTMAEQFDNQACIAFLETAKFKPALDVQGRPVPSYYISTIVYRLQ